MGLQANTPATIENKDNPITCTLNRTYNHVNAKKHEKICSILTNFAAFIRVRRYKVETTPEQNIYKLVLGTLSSDFPSDSTRQMILEWKSCLWKLKSYSTFCHWMTLPTAVMFFTPGSSNNQA